MFGPGELRTALRLARVPQGGRSVLVPTCVHSRFLLSGHFQTRTQHNNSRESRSRRSQPHAPGAVSRSQVVDVPHEVRSSPGAERHVASPEHHFPAYNEWPKVKVRYLRPAIWALVVTSGIFLGGSYLEAKRVLKEKEADGGWLQAPQLHWSPPKQNPPTPTEVATQWWRNMDGVSKVSWGIIGANTLVHASSFLTPGVWNALWHMPARNVNYTLFTSTWVHSGALHFFVNMYCLNNFMNPVGYSKLFEGSPYHLLSFFLSAGVLSGFAQHWSTLIPVQKRAIPEIFIRCGGASGALFGILGAFCMQYPTAGLGIIFVPVHFDAQYVLPAVMLFDFIGMVRGYSFVNFGHAAHFSGALCGVAYSYFDGKNTLWKPLVRKWISVLRKK
ncbi:hypothetical protein ACN47E_009957 [Coniothyrium glycines]